MILIEILCYSNGRKHSKWVLFKDKGDWSCWRDGVNEMGLRASDSGWFSLGVDTGEPIGDTDVVILKAYLAVMARVGVEKG